jgi:hypothetical protein
MLNNTDNRPQMDRGQALGRDLSLFLEGKAVNGFSYDLGKKWRGARHIKKSTE